MISAAPDIVVLRFMSYTDDTIFNRNLMQSGIMHFDTIGKRQDLQFSLNNPIPLPQQNHLPV